MAIMKRIHVEAPQVEGAAKSIVIKVHEVPVTPPADVDPISGPIWVSLAGPRFESGQRWSRA